MKSCNVAKILDAMLGIFALIVAFGISVVVMIFFHGCATLDPQAKDLVVIHFHAINPSTLVSPTPYR